MLPYTSTARHPGYRAALAQVRRAEVLFKPAQDAVAGGLKTPVGAASPPSSEKKAADKRRILLEINDERPLLHGEKDR